STRQSYRSVSSPDIGFDLEITYTVPQQPAVEIAYRIEAVNLECELPEYGLRFQIPKSLQRFCWHGHGPYSWYPDRKSAGLLSYFSTWIDQEFYLGNKGEVRWATWTDEEGFGFGVVFDKPGNVQCVPVDNRIEVRLNRLVAGLGTKYHRPPEKQRILLTETKTIEGRIILRPIGPYAVPEPFQTYLGPILDPRL
ncbi:MAG: hypothetical protein ABIH23_31105, partial [bacterium]